MASAASRIDGGTAFSAAREAMMMVGSVSSVSTNPPTMGAERGMPKKFRNTASPSRPNTIDGTAARLFDVHLDEVRPAVALREFLEIDGGGDAHGEGQQQRYGQRVDRANQRAPDAGLLRFRANPR